MREILFRGKVRHYGNYYYAQEWINGSYVKGALGVSIFTQEEDCYGNITRQSSVEVIPETIGQYTGLKDKNGKMIFEGDIIAGDGEDMPNRIVEWSNDYLEYFVGLGQDVWQSPLYDVVLPEVIGNIFDNLNLLTIKTNI